MPYTKSEKEDFLDLFYFYYPGEYKDKHEDLDYGAGVKTEDMYSELEYYCPVPFSHIKTLWDKGYRR